MNKLMDPGLLTKFVLSIQKHSTGYKLFYYAVSGFREVAEINFELNRRLLQFSSIVDWTSSRVIGVGWIGRAPLDSHCYTFFQLGLVDHDVFKQRLVRRSEVFQHGDTIKREVTSQFDNFQLQWISLEAANLGSTPIYYDSK